jgi:hypothetical protein
MKDSLDRFGAGQYVSAEAPGADDAGIAKKAKEDSWANDSPRGRPTAAALGCVSAEAPDG